MSETTPTAPGGESTDRPADFDAPNEASALTAPDSGVPGTDPPTDEQAVAAQAVDTQSEAPSSAIAADNASGQVDTLPEVDEKANEGRDLHMLAMDAGLDTDETARAKASKDIAAFLAGGGKIDSVNAARETCMHVACRFGTPALVKAFVMERVPLKLEAEGDWTPLLYVARDATSRVGAAGAVKMAAALLEGPAFEEPGGDAAGARDEHKAEQRKQKMVKWKMENAADVDATNVNGTTALHLAAGFGSSALVSLLLSESAKLTVNRKKWTPLHYVARFSVKTGQDGADIVNLLLDAGVDPNARTSEGATAVHLAAGYGSSDVLEALLRRAESHTIKEDIGWSALHYIARLACVDPDNHADAERKCKMVMEGYGWVYDAAAESYQRMTKWRSKNHRLPLHQAVLHATPAIVGLLLGATADEVSGLSKLHLVAKFGRCEDYCGAAAGSDSDLTEAEKALKLLLANGHSVWACAPDTGDYPLHYAAAWGTPKMVSMLIQSGAWNYGNSAGWQASHCAVHNAKIIGTDDAVKTLKVLQEAGFQIGSQLPSGESEIILAVRFADAAVLQLLLETAPPGTINLVDCDGNSALHHVAQLRQPYDDFAECDFSVEGAAEMCRLLVAAGADAAARNAAGDTPLHVAAACANAETLQAVLAAAAAASAPQASPLEARNNEGQTVMHVLAKSGVRLSGSESALAKARVLLAHGPQLRARDALGATPLHHASAFGGGELVAALIEAEAAAWGAPDALCLEADINGDTALHYLARHAVNALGDERALRACEALVARCPAEGLRAINRAGETPLHLACEFSNRAVVKTLIQAGASPYATNMQGLNALHYVSSFAKTCVKSCSRYQRDQKVEGICEELLLAYEAQASRRDLEDSWSRYFGRQSSPNSSFPLLKTTAARSAARALCQSLREEWEKGARPKGALGDRGVVSSVNALMAAVQSCDIMAAIGGERRTLLLGALRELSQIWSNVSATIEAGQSYEDSSILRRLLYGPFSSLLCRLHKKQLLNEPTFRREKGQPFKDYIGLFRAAADALNVAQEAPYWAERKEGLFIAAAPNPDAGAVFELAPANVFAAMLAQAGAGLSGSADASGHLTIRYLKMPEAAQALATLCDVCNQVVAEKQEEMKQLEEQEARAAGVAAVPRAEISSESAWGAFVADAGPCEAAQLSSFLAAVRQRCPMDGPEGATLREVLRELLQIWQLALSRVQVGGRDDIKLMAELCNGPFSHFLDAQRDATRKPMALDVLGLIEATLDMCDKLDRPPTLSPPANGMHARSAPGSGKGSGPRPLALNVFDALSGTLDGVSDAETPSSPVTQRLLKSALRVVGIGVDAPTTIITAATDVYKLTGALPLHGAVACGAAGTVRQLISAMKHRADMDGLPFDPDVVITETGHTALHVLATCCCDTAMEPDEIRDIVDALVDAGAKVTSVTPTGESVMHLAASSCNAALVEALVAAQLRNYGISEAAAAAQVEAPGQASTLHFMAQNMLPRLEAAMAADAAAAATPAPPQSSAAEGVRAVEAPRTLYELRLAKQAQVAAASAADAQQDGTSLSSAANEDRLAEECAKICRSLVAAGTLVRARDEAGNTALHVAVTYGNHIFVTALTRAVKDKMQASLWSAMKAVVLSKSLETAKANEVLRGMIDGARREFYPQLVAAFEGAAALLPALTALQSPMAGSTELLETLDGIAAAVGDGDADPLISELMQALTERCSVDTRAETQLALAVGAAIMLETKASKYSFTKLDATTGAKLSVLEERDREGRTPLHCVCLHGQATASPEAATRVAAALVAEGANVNATTGGGYTPLYYAAAGGTVAIIEALLEGGADINAKVVGSWTPLHYCARYAVERRGDGGALELLECLLQRGADPNALTDVPASIASKDAPGAPWQEAASGKSPLYLALAHGTPATVAALVSAGADAAKLNVQGWSATHYAARFGKDWHGEQDANRIVAALILAGAPVKESVLHDVGRLDPVKKIHSSLVPGCASKLEDYKPDEMALKAGARGMLRLLRKGEAITTPVLKELMLLAGPQAVAALSAERKRTLFAAVVKDSAASAETILSSCLS